MQATQKKQKGNAVVKMNHTDAQHIARVMQDVTEPEQEVVKRG